MMKNFLMLSVLLAAISTAWANYYDWQNEYDGTEANTVVLWNFDEFETPDRALNVVNNYRPYLIRQGASHFADDGKFGGCFRNVGGALAGDYGQIWGGDVPFPTGIDPSLSVEMWVSMDEYTPGVAYLIDKYGTTKSGYQIYLNKVYANRETVYRVYFNTGDTVTQVSVWADMVWKPGVFYHIACTWDAATDTAKIFRNGREYVAKTFPGVAITDSTIVARLANRALSSYAAFKGAIDGVRISSVAYQYAAPEPTGPYYDWVNEYDGSDAFAVALWNFNQNEVYLHGADTCAWNAFSTITVNNTSVDRRMILRGIATFEDEGGAYDPNLPGGVDGCFKNYGGAFAADFAFAWGGADIFPAGVDPSLTIESWVKFDDVTTNIRHQLVDKCWTTASGYQLYFYKEPWMGEGQYNSWLEVGNGTISARVTELCTFEAGRYYHIAGVWDAAADTLNLYIDGNLVGASYWPGLAITNNTQVLRIGNRLGSTYGCLQGTMDGLRISGIAYNFAPITQEFEAAIPGDINGDGIVNDADLAMLVGQWLTNSASGINYGGFFTPAADTKSALDEDTFYPDGQKMLFSWYGVNQYDLEKVKGSGFTAVGPYYGVDDATYLRGNAHLSYVDDFGLGVKYVYRLGMNLDWDDESFVMPSDSEIIAAITMLVNEVKDNQNIALWYIAPEELRPWMSNEMHYLELVTDTIRAVDTYNRPIWMYEPNHRATAELVQTGVYQDYLGKGSYPNTSGYEKERIWVRWSIEQVTGAAASLNAGTPINVLEMAVDPALAADYGLVNDYVRHDAYLSLIHGAKGIVVWSGGRRTGFNTFSSYQDAYLQLADELNGSENLADVFLYGQAKSDITVAVTSGPTTASASNGYSAPSISYASYNGIDGARYLFIVNSANAQVNVQVSGLPAAGAYIKDIFAQTGYEEATASMALNLSPWQVIAYKIASETAVCGLEGDLYLAADISGPDGSPDCIVNLFDYAAMANNWLDCEGESCL